MLTHSSRKNGDDNNNLYRRDIGRDIVQIVLFSVLTTVFLPALTSRLNNTFTKEELVNTICHKRCGNGSRNNFVIDESVCVKIRDEYYAYKNNETILYSIDRELSNNSCLGTALALSKKRDSLKKIVDDKDRFTYRLVPFDESPQLLLACMLYISLGILIFVYPPRWKKFTIVNSRFFHDSDISVTFRSIVFNRSLSRVVFGKAIIIFLFHYSELLVRNWLLHDSPLRKVYAYPNMDVDPYCFGVEFGISFIFSLLLAVLWEQWITANKLIIAENKRRFKEIEGITGIESEDRLLHDAPYFNRNRSKEAKNFIKHWKEVFFTQMLSNISLYFTRWEERSVILGLGFISYPAYYYVLLNRYDDHRYFIGALTSHALWLITWILISLPVVHVYVNWNKDKNWMLHFFEEKLFDDTNTKYENIKGREPFSGIALIIAGIAAVLSFLFPLIKLL